MMEEYSRSGKQPRFFVLCDTFTFGQLILQFFSQRKVSAYWPLVLDCSTCLAASGRILTVAAVIQRQAQVINYCHLFLLVSLCGSHGHKESFRWEAISLNPSPQGEVSQRPTHRKEPIPASFLFEEQPPYRVQPRDKICSDALCPWDLLVFSVTWLHNKMLCFVAVIVVSFSLFSLLGLDHLKEGWNHFLSLIFITKSSYKKITFLTYPKSSNTLLIKII